VSWSRLEQYYVAFPWDSEAVQQLQSFQKALESLDQNQVECVWVQEPQEYFLYQKKLNLEAYSQTLL